MMIYVATAQEQTAIDSVTKAKRVRLVASIFGGSYGASFISLNKAWYANYPRSRFQFYNDGKEWLQMDKVGHAWSGYQLSRASYAGWRWAGMSEKKAVLTAGISGFTFLTVIPIIEKLELAVILISEKLLDVPSRIAALICAESLSKTYCDAIVIEVLDGIVKSSS